MNVKEEGSLNQAMSNIRLSGVQPSEQDVEKSDKSIGRVGGLALEMETGPGAAWTEKYLHPPGDRRPEYAGITDINNTPSVHLEYRLEDNISTIQGGATVYPRVTMLILPGMQYPLAVFRTDQTGAVTQTGLAEQQNQAFNLESFIANAGSYRMAYKSTTAYLNATDFNNQGTVSTAKFRPEVQLLPTALFFEQYKNHAGFEECARKLRGLSKSKKPDDDFEVLGLKSSPGIANSVQVIKLGRVPTSPSEVLQLNPKSCSRPAKEGAFMVSGFTQPTQEYKSLANSSTSAVAPFAPIGTACYYEIYDPILNQNTITSFNSTKYPGLMFDVPWDTMEAGWIMFDGLSVAIGGAAAATPPYITLKTVIGAELEPLTTSVLQPLVDSAVVDDQKALRCGFGGMVQMQSSMPACANDFGSILATAAAYAPKVISWFSDLFGKKDGQKLSAPRKKVTKKTVKFLEPNPVQAEFDSKLESVRAARSRKKKKRTVVEEVVLKTPTAKQRQRMG